MIQSNKQHQHTHNNDCIGGDRPMKIHHRLSLYFVILILAVAIPLINAKASNNEIPVKDLKGDTRLIAAVRSGDTELVKQLLNKGADVNTKNAKGYNALLTAVDLNCYHGSNNSDIIKLLLKNGADIHAKNPDGETVLDLALACRKRDVVKDLSEAGVNLWTPETGKARVFLIDHGLKVDINFTVGNKSKYLNKEGGVVFVDIEPGKHPISAQSPSTFYHSAANLTSPVAITAGESYFFRIVEQEGGSLDYLSSLVRDKRNYPVRIIALKDVAAKDEIEKLLKLKESTEDIKSNASASAEKTNPVLSRPRDLTVSENRSDASAKATKPNLSESAQSSVQETNPEFFGYAQQLRELKKLKEEGLLTDKEYEQKRKAIVDKM